MPLQTLCDTVCHCLQDNAAGNTARIQHTSGTLTKTAGTSEFCYQILCRFHTLLCSFLHFFQCLRQIRTCRCRIFQRIHCR